MIFQRGHIFYGKSTYFALITYRAYEQLTSARDYVSAKPLGKLSRSVSQLFIVFCNIGNCLWKGLVVTSNLLSVDFVLLSSYSVTLVYTRNTSFVKVKNKP